MGSARRCRRCGEPGPEPDERGYFTFRRSGICGNCGDDLRQEKLETEWLREQENS